MPLPGIFEPTLFSGFQMRFPSRYILAPHPKTEIRPDPEAIERVLRAGWVGQMKVHGHRAQVHLCADENEPVLVYNRKGDLHKLELPADIEAELRRLFRPQKGWTALDAEWLKPRKHLYLFDYLKQDGKELDSLTYPERYALLPKHFISPRVTLLPLLNTVDKCLKILSSKQKHVEGLVFKSLTSTGFSDTSILRCRKRS